jgi:biofilm PGA synthesis protein PgaD
MDQSRPWAKTPELIIDRPEAQPPLQRAAFGIVTLAFWAAWVYLMMPAVTLLGWAFGVSRFVDVMIKQGGAFDVVRLIGWYLLVISVMCGALIGWAMYNWARFRGMTRRSNAPRPLSNSRAAAHLGVEEKVLGGWQRAKVLEVYFDDHGAIAAIEPARTRSEETVDQPG